MEHEAFDLIPPCYAQDDPTIIGWNLFNEPRCNCNPSVIDPSTGKITAEPAGSNCGNIVKCTADMTVRHMISWPCSHE